MNSSRRDFLKQLGIGLAAIAVSGYSFAAKALTTSAPAKKTAPNIILIMADDMGFSDIGCYGSEIATPNLDALAKNGLRFTQFYNGARCCPTRAALLTGLYAHQAGMGGMEPDWEEPGYRGNINKQCVTLAEALKQNGYATYMTGKWHLTNKTRAKTKEEKFNWPCQRGFDRLFGTIAGAGNFFAPKTLTRDNEDITNEAEQDDSFYYTDAISSNTVMFINEHCQTKKDTPFFQYVAYTAPHWPLHALPEDIKKYHGKYKAGWDVLRKERHERLKKLGLVNPKWKLSDRTGGVPAWDDLEKAGLPKHLAAIPDITLENLKEYMELKMAIYAAQIDRMDQGIGKIVNALKKNGILDNTLIVFLADNGGCAEYSNYGFGTKEGNTMDKLGSKVSNSSYGAGWANASNSPFRYYKHYAHEGGIGTPFIVHWPKVIKDGGAIRQQVGHIIDIMPTFLDVAGGTYPNEYKGNKITPVQGVSLVPAFMNKPLKRTDAIYWEHHGNRAVRGGKWKLVANGEASPWELYDMEADRTETTNLAETHPEIVKELNDKWWAWAKRSNVLPMNPNKKKPKPKKKNQGKKKKENSKQKDNKAK
jgi:arylsulfatase